MRLFIAEKPSLAKAIAAVLPEPRRNRRGFIECGSDDIVAWCAGHILEQAPPEVYDVQFKTWQLDHLPISPRQWKLVVKTPELLENIRTLLKRADRVVHAGDPDREGQLLVDEVLDFLAYRGPVDRILVSDLNPPAVQRALRALQPNQKFRPLCDAALARQRADWVYGMNLTRLYTLLGRAGGYDGVLSVGRVQTPVLGLVVQRDLLIENFQPKPIFVVQAELVGSAGTFTATWQPGEDARSCLDDEGRLVVQDKAITLCRSLTGKSGRITGATTERKAEPPPLLYSLADLQIDAAKRLGFTAKEVLDLCQSLYETHKLITYPRSDCAHLPEDHHGQAVDVVAAIIANAPDLARFSALAQLSRRSRAWNTAKVTAHHAIVPTPTPTSAQLTDHEKAIYGLVARRYLAQFFPPHEYNLTQLEATIADQRFTVSGRQPLAVGWKALLPASSKEGAEQAADPNAAAAALPPVKAGDNVLARTVEALQRITTPPKRFSDATLLQAMTAIGRFVSDPQIKKILQETDGLGTPATQAQIIQTLFDRRFLQKTGRQISSTPTGRALIATLPRVATTPDMTAVWEAGLRRIHDGEKSHEEFLTRVLAQVADLVERGKRLGRLKSPDAQPCPQPGCTGFIRRVKGKRGIFPSCTLYPACQGPTARSRSPIQASDHT